MKPGVTGRLRGACNVAFSAQKGDRTKFLKSLALTVKNTLRKLYLLNGSRNIQPWVRWRDVEEAGVDAKASGRKNSPSQHTKPQPILHAVPACSTPKLRKNLYAPRHHQADFCMPPRQ